MEEPLAMVLRDAETRPPRPLSWQLSSALTTLRRRTADYAVRMLPSRLQNWLNPPLLPTTEVVSLTGWTTSRQGPRTSKIRLLVITVLAALGLLFFLLALFYKWTVNWLVEALQHPAAMSTSEQPQPQYMPAVVRRMEEDFSRDRQRFQFQFDIGDLSEDLLMNQADLDKLYKKLEGLKVKEELYSFDVRTHIRPVWLRRSGKCVVPANPENGSYAVTGAPNANPGDIFESAELTVTCQPNFRILGEEKVICTDGNWSDYFPECVYESDELDNKKEKTKPVKKPHKYDVRINNRPVWLRRSGKCVVPANPENGSYALTDAPNANPGERFESAELTVTCQPNFRVLGEEKVICTDGNWSDYFPECVHESNELDKEQETTKPVQKPNRDYLGKRLGRQENRSGKCVMPDHPENGSYAITNARNANPSDRFESAVLTVTCQPNFSVSGEEKVICADGNWSAPIPKCVRFCKLPKHASVRYKCLVKGAIKGTRKCNHTEPSGTEVKPRCKNSNYYSAAPLPLMRCIDGTWNYHAVCSPECGRVTPTGDALALGGRSAKHGELPWHVGIYRKDSTSYTQECGGSIVSNRLVISAAHCFWKRNMKQPASRYAVAAGKIHRSWNDINDTDAQKSFVNEIKIPARFRGDWLNFQNDIALLILKTPFKYTPYVSPVCLNFSAGFDNRQLQPVKMGKVSGWGLTAENGESSHVLQVVELPYIDVEECINASPPGFTKYITSDKFCAGFSNGTAALCRGDSGGGLAFPESERGTNRYYLRGIVSTAPKNENLCNSHALTTFTHILKYQEFIAENLPVVPD